MPKKYFKLSKSLISNLFARDFFVFGIFASSFPVTTISLLQYHRHTQFVVTIPGVECLIKSVLPFLEWNV
jgi:hypothetical protein